MTDSVLMEVDNDPQVGEKRKADKGKAPLSAADESKKNQMWVEKYRPSRLADVAAHKDIIDTISRLTTEDKLPHLLLYGPPGTGKTSTILAVARELYGASFAQMVLELNASDGTRLAREGRRGRTSDGIARRLLPVISDLAFKFSRISRLTRTALPPFLFVFSHPKRQPPFRSRHRRRAQRDPVLRLHDAFRQQGLQADHPGRVRQHDQGRAVRVAADHREVH
jgi:hypothetical protein